MPPKRARRKAKKPTLSNVTIVCSVPVSAGVGVAGVRTYTATNLLGDMASDANRRVIIHRVQVQTIPTQVACTLAAQFNNVPGLNTGFVTVSPRAVSTTSPVQFTIKARMPQPVPVVEANPLLVLNTISCQAAAGTQYVRVTTFFEMEPDAVATYVP